MENTNCTTHTYKIEDYTVERRSIRVKLDDFKSKSLKKFKEKHFFRNQLFKRLPILEWLPKYQLSYLMPDFFAGFTVGVMNIAQGMAYALLANVDPVNGLYISFFPLLVYVFFGTSKDLAMGNYCYLFC